MSADIVGPKERTNDVSDPAPQKEDRAERTSCHSSRVNDSLTEGGGDSNAADGHQEIGAASEADIHEEKTFARFCGEEEVFLAPWDTPDLAEKQV